MHPWFEPAFQSFASIRDRAYYSVSFLNMLSCETNLGRIYFWEPLFLIKAGVPWRVFFGVFSFGPFFLCLPQVSERDLKAPEIYAARDRGMGFFSCIGRPRRERSEACVYYRSGFTKAVHLRAPLPALAVSLASARLPAFLERARAACQLCSDRFKGFKHISPALHIPCIPVNATKINIFTDHLKMLCSKLTSRGLEQK